MKMQMMQLNQGVSEKFELRPWDPGGTHDKEEAQENVISDIPKVQQPTCDAETEARESPSAMFIPVVGQIRQAVTK